MARAVAGRRRAAAALPEWIPPQLTQLFDAAPEGDDWLHDKFDGYRMHARLDRGAVKLLTRTGLDWERPPYPAAIEDRIRRGHARALDASVIPTVRRPSRETAVDYGPEQAAMEV